MPYESPDEVEFRGDFKPELVHLLMRMRLQQLEGEDKDQLADLTAEQIKELLEKSVELEFDPDEMDMSAFTAFIENLDRGAGSPPAPPTTSRAGAPSANAPWTRARRSTTTASCASTPASSTRRSASSSC